MLSTCIDNYHTSKYMCFIIRISTWRLAQHSPSRSNTCLPKNIALHTSSEERFFYSSPFETEISSTKIDTGLIKIHIIYGKWCWWCGSNDHRCKMNCNSTKRDLSVCGFCCTIYYHESRYSKANNTYWRARKDGRLYGAGQSLLEEFYKIF